MRRIRNLLISVFGFSGAEVNAFLVLIPLLLAMTIGPSLYRNHLQPEVRWSVQDSVLQQQFIDEIDSRLVEKDQMVSPEFIEEKKLFTFDPNDVTQKEMLSLGIAEKIAGRIDKYRKAGGTFAIRSDLMKIYGFDSLLYTELAPFIAIPQRPNHVSRVNAQVEVFEPKLVLGDVNQADTSDLKEIYGIGRVLSSRIVSYRELLGGFVNLQQLNEVYGLKPEVVDRLKERYLVSADFEPRKININRDDYDKLTYHPYISKNLARAILAYRLQHGVFADLNDLLKVDLLDEETFAKISPYLQLGSGPAARE